MKIYSIPCVIHVAAPNRTEALAELNWIVKHESDMTTERCIIDHELPEPVGHDLTGLVGVQKNGAIVSNSRLANRLIRTWGIPT